MNQMIEYLQKIQDNLIGILLPVLITAFVSLVTVLINAVMQIIIQNSKINNEEYKFMQVFYPKIKLLLLEIKLTMQEIESNSIYTDMQTTIRKFINYTKDEVKYRKEHENEIQDIDRFITSINNYSIKIIELNNCLLNNTIPRIPIMHPILKKRINKMIAVLRYYSLLWNQYQTHSISVDIFQKEMDDFKKNWSVEFTNVKIDIYLSLLDKWLLIY